MISNVMGQKVRVGSEEIMKRISAKAFGHFIEDDADEAHSISPNEDVLSDLKSITSIAFLK